MSELLDHYLKQWNLSDPEPLTETVTSHLYTVNHDGERVVLKILTDYGWEERMGAVALRHYNGHGAVRLLNSDDGAQLLEYASGGDLLPFVRRGDDAGATRIIAGVIQKLHADPPTTPPDGVFQLPRWFHALLNKAESDSAAGDESIYVRAAVLAKELLATEREKVVLHGDIHHENVRYREGRGWLAIDPKGLYGERTYDTANTLCNPNPLYFPESMYTEARVLSNAKILSDTLKIDLYRLLQFAFVYACLSAAWSLTSNDNTEHALSIAKMVEPHIQ